MELTIETDAEFDKALAALTAGGRPADVVIREAVLEMHQRTFGRPPA